MSLLRKEMWPPVTLNAEMCLLPPWGLKGVSPARDEVTEGRLELLWAAARIHTGTWKKSWYIFL